MERTKPEHRGCWRRWIAVGTAVIGLALMTMTGPVAAQYPATGGPFDAIEQVNCEWIVSGSGFAPGAIVTFELNRDSVIFAQTVTDATGSFAVTLTITRDMPRGRQDLIATGVNPGGGLHVLSASVVVPKGCGGNNGAAFPIGSLHPPSGPGPGTVLLVVMLLAAVFVGTTVPQRFRPATA